MTIVDKLLQRWRIAKAKPFLRPGMRVLDVGCGQGELLSRVSELAPHSLGIEPALGMPVTGDRFRVVHGFFPQDIPEDSGIFDAITMLAVLEHFPDSAYEELGPACGRLLKPGGLIVITVPSPMVDRILAVLKAFGLVHGMSLEEHHGYDPEKTLRVFDPASFELVCREKFQFGLNNLFVFKKQSGVRNLNLQTNR